MGRAVTLYIVIPCFNEEEVLPVTAPLFLGKISELIKKSKIKDDSRILFVDDGSRDKTWEVISELSKQDVHYSGISLSRNRGHQNALLAGLMESRGYCDIAISMDCDGQDDINAVDEMIEKYFDGCDVVYGVRSKRDTDTLFKRFSAEGFYKLLRWMGAEVIFNHADYRLLSKRVLQELANFREVNIFLRGMIPLVGFKSTSVYYERHSRVAGSTHYPIKKMVALALDGVTSLSIKPIRFITNIGILVAFLGFLGILWAVIMNFSGRTVSGWTSTMCVVCFMGGIQLFSLGVIGEYVGKIYLETKQRPRYIIGEKTGCFENT